MRISATLFWYLARQITIGIAVAFFALSFLIFLVDIVELNRRGAGDTDVNFAIVLKMALLHLPYLAQQVVPYAVLLGTMLALARLNRSSELVIARSSGVSNTQMLMPGILVAFGIGVFAVTAFNPFASALLSRYEQIDARYLRGEVSNLAVSSEGLWLRQADDFGESVIHAKRISPTEIKLHDVIIFRFEGQDKFIERIDAETADLHDGYWQLSGTLITGPDRLGERRDSYRFETELTVDRIQESFASPETLSFWQMPAFVALLERAGFSSLKHRVHWHKVLASPLLLAGMVLIGATFSLRLTRRGGTGLLIAIGVVAGFVLYVFSDVILALGLSAKIPAEVSAWAPALVAVLVGSGLLLYVREA